MKQSVLFLCVHNSARSQMAEGLLRHIAGDRFEVASAGIEAGSVRPEAVEVMREIGIDISHHRSKRADELSDRSFDLVVTTCDEAKDACPLFPGAPQMLHWGFPDPAAVTGTHEERLRAFRRVRDGLRDEVQQLARVTAA
ncbi:MAG: arsenate reductase ArsC [Candidatus Limnocylindria bacterium]